jgi:hypothetical protein
VSAVSLSRKRKTELAFGCKYNTLSSFELHNGFARVLLFVIAHNQVNDTLECPVRGIGRKVLGISDFYQLARGIQWIDARLDVFWHVNVKGTVEWGVVCTGLENGDDFPVSDAGVKLFGVEVFTVLQSGIQVVFWAAAAKQHVVIDMLIDKASSLVDFHGALLRALRTNDLSPECIEWECLEVLSELTGFNLMERHVEFIAEAGLKKTRL